MKFCLVFLAFVFFSSMTHFPLSYRLSSVEAVLYHDTVYQDSAYGDAAGEEEYKKAVIFDLFDKAEAVTGVPAEILRGIAAAESDFRRAVIGDYGYSLGMFQLHKNWHEYRVAKWGEFDPFNPYEAAIIAGRILARNLAAFNGDWHKAIAAYRQGVTGVRRNGATAWYVERVLNWRECEGRMRSFVLFMRNATTWEVLYTETPAAAQEQKRVLIVDNLLKVPG